MNRPVIEIRYEAGPTIDTGPVIEICYDAVPVIGTCSDTEPVIGISR